MLGVHLLLDAVMGEVIGEKDVEQMLQELPERIGMKIIGGPLVVKGEECNPGWTGFVIIDKSHIAVHSFEETNLVSIDVYSCKSFNAKAVVDYLRGRFKLERISTRIITREVI
jgi:S-adenosylmethionine decarboxylase